MSSSRSGSISALQVVSGASGARDAFVILLAGFIVLFAFTTRSTADPCVVPDDGSGTVTLPPAGCDYLSPDEVHLIIDGLPPGTTIELAPIHKDFICNEQIPTCSIPIPPGECEATGGALGGNGDCFQSGIEVLMTGTGLLAGFARNITLPLDCEIHTAPRILGAPVQSFPSEMISCQGQLFGDPDFATLQIQAGSSFGLPSPGHTTLTDLGNGTFNVDSFFDVAYEIDFIGAPGSILEGMAGTTQGTVRMQAGEPITVGNPCEVADNGTGTITLPPQGCQYLSPDDVHEIIDGLPPGTTIELSAIHKDFFCGTAQAPVGICSVTLAPGECETQGGTLSGSIDCFHSDVELQITGTGALAGYQRTITVPVESEAHTGPRNPGDSVQQFPNDMFRLDGEIFGDPDFDILRIRAGTAHGLPSPGLTRLTDLGNGQFQVDSFFDVAYTIEFQGAPGGILDGLGGTTQATVRMSTGNEEPTQQSTPGLQGLWIAIFVLSLAGASVFVIRRRGAGLE